MVKDILCFFSIPGAPLSCRRRETLPLEVGASCLLCILAPQTWSNFCSLQSTSNYLISDFQSVIAVDPSTSASALSQVYQCVLACFLQQLYRMGFLRCMSLHAFSYMRKRACILGWQRCHSSHAATMGALLGTSPVQSYHSGLQYPL